MAPWLIILPLVYTKKIKEHKYAYKLLVANEVNRQRFFFIEGNGGEGEVVGF